MFVQHMFAIRSRVSKSQADIDEISIYDDQYLTLINDDSLSTMTLVAGSMKQDETSRVEKGKISNSSFVVRTFFFSSEMQHLLNVDIRFHFSSFAVEHSKGIFVVSAQFIPLFPFILRNMKNFEFIVSPPRSWNFEILQGNRKKIRDPSRACSALEELSLFMDLCNNSASRKRE